MLCYARIWVSNSMLAASQWGAKDTVFASLRTPTHSTVHCSNRTAEEVLLFCLTPHKQYIIGIHLLKINITVLLLVRRCLLDIRVFLLIRKYLLVKFNTVEMGNIQCPLIFCTGMSQLSQAIKCEIKWHPYVVDHAQNLRKNFSNSAKL
ncbi:hypothetical protein AMTRI_Chr03g54670 [Amborella trichopoda]